MAFENPWTPITTNGFASGSVTNTAKRLAGSGGISSSRPSGATGARVQVLANDTAQFTDLTVICRFRVDGTNPTSSTGLVLGHGDFYECRTPEEIDQFLLISADGTDQVNVSVQFYANTLAG